MSIWSFCLTSNYVLRSALLCVVILKPVFGLVDGLLAAVVILLVSLLSDNCHKGGLLVVLTVLGIKIKSEFHFEMSFE